MEQLVPVVEAALLDQVLQAVDERDVAVFADQDLAHVGVLFYKAEDVRNHRQRSSVQALHRMTVQNAVKILEHLLFNLLHHVEHVFVVQVKSPPVDIHQIGQFLDGDVFDALLFKQLREALTQLLFCFAHAAVHSPIFHSFLRLPAAYFIVSHNSFLCSTY